MLFRSGVTFIDRSWNTDAAYTRLWSFPGGNPSTSADSIPVVQYPGYGTYDVTLTVTNASGSQSIVRNGFVNIIPAQGTQSAPFTEGFETLSFPGSFWFSENESGNGWQVISGTAYTGNKCISLNNYSGNPYESVDAFITEGYDFSNLLNPTFDFKYAFATRNSSTDNLRVYYSIDCGRTWILRFNKSGSALTTAGNQFNNFTPTSLSQWKNESLMVAALSGKQNVRFKFEFHNLGGNNIYVDDINIGGLNAGLNELNPGTVNFEVSPNPAHENFNVSFEIEKSSAVSLQLFDILGNKLQSIVESELSSGKHQFTIENHYAAGIYVLKLCIDSKTTTQKIVIE